MLRTLNAPVYPFDYRAAVDDLRRHVRGYADAAAGRFDFSPAFAELDALGAALDRFYAALDARPPADPAGARDVNAVQRLLGRGLVALSYSRDGRFRQDPARTTPPLPDLAPARQLAGLADGSDLANVLGIHLTRGQNRLAWTCRTARQAVEQFLQR